MTIIYKAYDSALEVGEKLDNELTRLRLWFEDRKLKIESLEWELLMAKDKCIILNDKREISISERNILFCDNKRLNAKICSLHNSIDVLEANEKSDS